MPLAKAGKKAPASVLSAARSALVLIAPVPLRTMSKGFSSLSLLAMCSVAVLTPVAVGVNRTVNVVLPPPGTSAPGLAVTANMP